MQITRVAYEPAAAAEVVPCSESFSVRNEPKTLLKTALHGWIFATAPRAYSSPPVMPLVPNPALLQQESAARAPDLKPAMAGGS